MSILKVKWLDAVRDISGWVNVDDYDFENHEKSMVQETTGYFVRKSSEVLYLCHSIGNDRVDSMLSIPFGSIISVTTLRGE